MKNKKEITPLDIAICGENLNILLQKSRDGKVIGELCAGVYFPTSGGLIIKNQQTLIKIRAKTVENALCMISAEFSDRENISDKHIGFHKDYLTLFVLKEDAQIGIYPSPEENLSFRDFSHFKEQDLEKKRIVEMHSEKIHATIPLIPKHKGILRNGNYVGIDALGKYYTLFNEKSEGLIGALIRMNNNVRYHAIKK